MVVHVYVCISVCDHRVHVYVYLMYRCDPSVHGAVSVLCAQGWTPVNAAAYNGHEACVLALAKAGANIDAKNNNVLDCGCRACAAQAP